LATESLSLLFTGHMVDLSDRSTPRFPPRIVEPVREEIWKRVSYHVGTCDPSVIMGFASLARGGDILFHEACRALGVATAVVLPFAPDKFITTSVEGTEGGNWLERFWRIWEATPEVAQYMLDLPVSDDAYAECNNRLLTLAREHGSVQLIALWDGAGGGGTGGTGDFVQRAKETSGREPDIIDPNTFLSQN
jgi:hypothetical protein